MATAPPTNTKAVLSVVFGVISFVLLPLAWITGPVTLVLALMARREIARSGGGQGGAGLALAGLVLGWIVIALLVLAVLFFVALVAARGNGVRFGY